MAACAEKNIGYQGAVQAHMIPASPDEAGGRRQSVREADTIASGVPLDGLDERPGKVDPTQQMGTLASV